MTGFDNENQIIDALNNVQFNKLNNNLKKAILKINNNKKPSIILAKKYGVNLVQKKPTGIFTVRMI